MRFVVALAVVLAVFAGCSGAGQDPSDEGLDAEPGEHPMAPDGPLGNGTHPANAPPEVGLNVSVDGLVAAFHVAVVDADGDNVTWSLDADGDGVADANGTGPGQVHHTYAAAGEFTALLNATDGHLSASARLIVNVSAPPPPLPGQHATGSFYAGGATLIGCFGDIFGVGYPAQLEGIFYDTFAVEPHTVGYAYQARVSAGTAQDSPGFGFLRADRSVLTSGFMSTHATGTVPEGAAFGVWWTCAGGLLTGTFDSTPIEVQDEAEPAP